jgi:hypothetical protein
LQALVIVAGILLSNVASSHPNWPYTTDKIKPRYELKVQTRKEKRIEKIISNLEHVPDQVQQLCNDHGGKVIIFDNNIADLEHMRYLKYQKPRGWYRGEWEAVVGAYNIRNKEVMIKQKYYKAQASSVNAELHEYGHMVDYIFGETISEEIKGTKRLSNTKRFIKIHEKYANKKVLGIFDVLEPYFKYLRDEFFAERFAEFYYSKKTRKSLERKFPEAHEYFKLLEESMGCIQ